METLKFKTNINCSSCVAKDEKSIENWSVDTATADKVLTVSGEHLDKNKVKDVVTKAGFIIKGEL